MIFTKVSGIVCEYNPFHNGHLYQISETKKMGATHIVSVMSGDFVQRGEPALINKHKRAEIAVKSGADLVIELPVPYCVATAELFARAAVHILNSLGVVDILSFGSECGEIELLKRAADVSEGIVNSTDFKELISKGNSYPSALYTLIKDNNPIEIAEVFNSPNNTLAIEYLKSLKYLNSKIEPVTIKRSSVEHDSQINFNDFASASFLRKSLLQGGNVDKYIPPACAEILQISKANGELSSINNLKKIIFYKLKLMTREQISEIPDANNGLSDRLYKAISVAGSLEELLTLAKTKCFTLARIRRVITYALLGITNEDFKKLPPYGRILAFNDKGCEILAKSKKESAIPFSTSLSFLSGTDEYSKRFARLDENASSIINLAADNFQPNKNEYAIKIEKAL